MSYDEHDGPAEPWFFRTHVIAAVYCVAVVWLCAVVVIAELIG